MDQELEILIKERYKILPDEIKEAFKALPLDSIMQEIAKNNNLHTDQIGILYTETLLIMLGVEKISNFKNNIKSNLQITSEKAEKILVDINQMVFLSIRSFLQTIDQIHEKLESENVAEETLTRDSILSEIENPTPAVHPISIADQTIAGPAKSMEIMVEPQKKETKDTVAHDFIAGKMTETVSLPSQKYSADPYREPIA